MVAAGRKAREDGAGALAGVGESVDADIAVEQATAVFGSGIAGVAVGVVALGTGEVLVIHVLAVQIFVPRSAAPLAERGIDSIGVVQLRADIDRGRPAAVVAVEAECVGV